MFFFFYKMGRDLPVLSGVIRNVSKNQVIIPPLKPTQYSGEPGGRGLGGKGKWEVQVRMDTYMALFLPPCLWEKKRKKGKEE